MEEDNSTNQLLERKRFKIIKRSVHIKKESKNDLTT
jgi:hypothetical protein